MREDGPQSFALRAGTIAVIPQGAWHRFHSSEGVTLMTATPSPSEVIELDVDDPRTVRAKAGMSDSRRGGRVKPGHGALCTMLAT